MKIAIGVLLIALGCASPLFFMWLYEVAKNFEGRDAGVIITAFMTVFFFIGIGTFILSDTIDDKN